MNAVRLIELSAKRQLSIYSGQMILDFSADEFRRATVKEQAAMCRAMAEEALQLAASEECKRRLEYAELAKLWFGLADEIERGAAN